MKTIEKSEAAWRGEVPPLAAPVNELSKLTRDVWFFNGMSNMVVVNTAEGLVIIDPGALFPDGVKRWNVVAGLPA